ncbi:MAG: hypothetical protein ACHQNV_09800 [Vicinamibacteria bacterium]
MGRIIAVLVVVALAGSACATSWAGDANSRPDPGGHPAHPFEVFVDAGGGTPLDFGGQGFAFGSSSSDLSQSWRRGVTLSGGFGVGLDACRILLVSVHYGTYEFELSKFVRDVDVHSLYTDVRGSTATSLEAVLGMRFHKDLPNAWPYF